MATNPRTISTTIHGKEIGLNHQRKLVVKNGYIVEGTPKAIWEFGSDGLAVESLAAYGQFSSTQNQVPVANDTPVLITHNVQDTIFGITQSVGAGFTVQTTGRYQIIAGAQIAKASGSALRTLAMWLRKNDVDVPRSAVENGITSLDTTVLILNYCIDLVAGDNIKIYMATPDITGGIGLYVGSRTNVPVIPAIMTSFFKIR